MSHTSELRVGIVPYLNMLPLVHGLEGLKLDDEPGASIRIVSTPPSRMAGLMESGDLDVGMVPVAALFEHPEWRIVGKSMIGSRGPVLSVLVLAKDSPEALTLLHPDSHSRTSNAMVRVILDRRFGARPTLGGPTPIEGWSPPQEPSTGEAFLLIGTRALRWRDHWRDKGGVALDLGRLWTEWTGLPFIYAVWTAREGVELGGWMEAFERLKVENSARLESIIAQWPGLEFERLSAVEAKTYLTENIIFDLDDRALEGLKRYQAEGKALGLFPENWKLIRG